MDTNTKYLYYILIGIFVFLLLVNIYLYSRDKTIESYSNDENLDSESEFENDAESLNTSNVGLVNEPKLDNLEFKNTLQTKNDLKNNNAYINKQIKEALKKEEADAKLILETNNMTFSEDLYETTEPEAIDNPNEDLSSMFNKLENMEYLCDNITRRQKLKDNLEQIRTNELAIKELNEQEKQIDELKRVVKHLRIEKAKKDIITSKCRNKKQKMVNTDYENVSKLAKDGLLKDEALNVNLNMGLDKLKNLGDLSKMLNITNNGSSNSDISSSCKKCDIDPKKMIHKSKLNNEVCLGCTDKLINSDLIKNKF